MTTPNDQVNRRSPRRSTAALATLMWLLFQLPAPAADIPVGSGCTLAEAIRAANEDRSIGGCSPGSGADRVILDADVTLTTLDNTVDGPNGLPSVISEVTVRGQGFEIARGTSAPPFRIFHVGASGDLTLKNTTVSNGGGTLFDDSGGGVFNTGVLSLVGSDLSGNGTRYGSGGGLANMGTATLRRSTISGNSAYSGGGLYNYGTLTLLGSTVSGNSAAYGGGGTVSGNLKMYDSTISNNLAAYTGGGITMEAGTLTLTSSTVSGNSATGSYSSGGGIWAMGGAVTLTNSTLSGNVAPRTGAALYQWQGASTLTNSTVAGNNGGGGAVYANAASVTLANSLLAASTVANCAVYEGGTIVDGGNNKATDGTCGTIPADLTWLDPVLADNGGLSMTHALEHDSSAINAAGDCGLATDQRGAPRFDGDCDSGAFEFGGCPVLQLMDDSIAEVVAYDDCEIEVGPDFSVLGPSGDLTLIGGRQVVLGDGVTVEEGGALTISLDPQLQVSSALEARDRTLKSRR